MSLRALSQLAALSLAAALAPQILHAQTLYPANNAAAINPDVQLRLSFDSPPAIGDSGSIRIFDAEDGRLVDELDMSIPPGPTERATGAALEAPYIDFPYPYAELPSGRTNANTAAGTPTAGAAPPPGGYQLSIIGGFTDGFHFYPVIVDGNTAIVQLHHNLLEYGKTYYAEVDAEVFPDATPRFTGLTGDSAWRFSTKPASAAPDANASELVVSTDGSGDFNTVQGAMDFVPVHGSERVTVHVRSGTYHEIVYFRNKSNVTIRGEAPGAVRITYANGETFNPHPVNLKTNEHPGTYPSRRATFMADNSSGIHLVNLVIENSVFGQAEGLLVNGSRNILSNVHVIGSGDALQANGSTYIVDSEITGAGDTILGRGPSYFERSTLRSQGVFMWIRNTRANHGNVFKDCEFIGTGNEPTTIARSPQNNASTYSYAEAVLLNCTLSNIAPEGWGPADLGGHVHFWEFESRNPDGSLVDVSERAAWSRQLDAEADAELIRQYSDPAVILDGWTPRLEDAAAAFAQSPVTIHLAGDSTMAPKEERVRPETGWGEALATMLEPNRFVIDNRARNGRSTQSFIDEGRWQALLDDTQPGDWVFIQFGHNDQKATDPDPYAPTANFRDNLRRFVADVRARDATPVLMTPVMRRRYDENGQFYDTHGEYPDIVRQVAAELDVAFIDMHALTGQLLRRLGPDDSRKLFLMLDPGEHDNYPEGIEDNTHFSPEGARAVAQLAAAPFLEMTSGAETAAAASQSLIVDADRQPDLVIPLWPDGPPGGENVAVEEYLQTRTNSFGLDDHAAANITNPTLSVFRAADPDGSAMLISPGGGYSYIVVEHEGWESARWFSRRGTTVYVMTYRLPQQGWAAGPDTPLQDAQRAMRLIRSRAAQDGIDPERVMVMGFSAGGHVAGSLATRFAADVYEPVDNADELPARPDAAILIYPVVTMEEPYTHGGTRNNLIGPSPRRGLVTLYSVETDPPADTPPVFLLHASDDSAVPVENSIHLYEALRSAEVPVVMHIFDTGGHGFGVRGLDDLPLGAWPQLVHDFAAAQGITNRPSQTGN